MKSPVNVMKEIKVDQGLEKKQAGCGDRRAERNVWKSVCGTVWSSIPGLIEATI